MRVVADAHAGGGAMTRRDVTTQPDIWRRAAAVADASRVLPQPGEPVLTLGCGTSYYVGQAYARLRTAAGLGPTRSEIPSELDRLDPDETVILLSRSGTTGDLLATGSYLRGSHRLVVIAGDPNSPLSELAPSSTIMLDFADEQSLIQTRFATAGLTVLRRSLGEEIEPIAVAGTAALDADLPLAGAPFRALRHVVFLGTGWAAAIAQEAALKVREAAGFWSEAYPLFEYLHGPISCADDRSLVWSFSAVPDDVASEIRRTGATLEVSPRDPQAELVRVHRLALDLAAREGRDADRPRHLNRSVARSHL